MVKILDKAITSSECTVILHYYEGDPFYHFKFKLHTRTLLPLETK